MKRPEKTAKTAKPEDFIKIGISVVWAVHVLKLYETVDKLRTNKATQVHQSLNGYRKKNKLDIPALQLAEVEAWFAES